MVRISHERIIKGVVNLGLRQSEAEVFVHLAKQGPQEARTIAGALRMHEHLIHRTLRSLKNREIVNANPERPAEFSAIPFDKALELLVKAHLKESQKIEQQKEEILDQWHCMTAKQIKS